MTRLVSLLLVLVCLSAPAQSRSFWAPPLQPSPEYLQPILYSVPTVNQTGTVGRVYLSMVYVPASRVATGIRYLNGTSTPAGNFTAGLYGPLARGATTCAGAALVATTVSTLAAGNTSAPVSAAFTSAALLVGDRNYCTAFEVDSTSFTYSRGSNAYGPFTGASSYFDQAGGVYGALPSTAPAVTGNPSSIPIVWLAMQ